MTTIVAILVLKLVTLAGSIATTAGFVGLFAFRETLAPHLPALWVSGLLAILVGEGGAWLVGRHAAASLPDHERDGDA